MLQRLRLHNFQRHSRLDIEFDPQVTVLVGKTDAGKSAVLRALKWLMLNRPRGDAFIRNGSERCKVMLLCDGHTISRSKGKSNQYKLAGQVFKAFSNDVPEPVAQLLNAGSLNFQDQHDPSFWFHLTSGQLAQELNAIVDLSVIDRFLARLHSKLRKAKSTVDVSQTRLREALAAQETLSDVPELARSFEQLQTQQQRADELKQAIAELSALVQTANKRRLLVQVLLGTLMDAEELNKRTSSWLALSSRCQALAKLVSSIQQRQAALQQGLPDISTLVELENEASKLRKQATQLQIRISQIRNGQSSTQTLAESLQEARAKLKQCLGKECPTCGQPIVSL